MLPEALAHHTRQLLFDRIKGLIGLANKAGKIIGGGSMVSDALKSRVKPGLVIVATDVSEAIGGKIISSANVQRVPYRTAMTKDDFGAILGKAPRSAVAIKSGGFVPQLLKAIDRYRNFLGEA
jgi:ribosomal protein L7Ae-like RNA K-turn-binding protein